MSTAVIYFCNLLVGLSVMVNLMVGLRFPFFFLFQWKVTLQFWRLAQVYAGLAVGRGWPFSRQHVAKLCGGWQSSALPHVVPPRQPAPAWQPHPCRACSAPTRPLHAAVCRAASGGSSRYWKAWKAAGRRTPVSLFSTREWSPADCW